MRSMGKSFEGIVLEGSSRTVPHLLVAAAGNYAPLIAITDGQKSVAYRDLPSLASASALKLQKLGVAPDDRVMVVAENSFELLELLLGAAWLGAILVPVNPTSRAGQLRYLVESTEPRLILMDESVQDRWDASGDKEYLEFATQLIPAITFDFDEVLETEIEQVLSNSEPGSTLAILFTSGTTGKPKGVMCPNGQFVRWGEVVGAMLKMAPGEIAQTTLPLFHTNALNALMQCLIHGSTFYLAPRFSVSQFWQRIVDSGATITYLLGAMVTMLTAAPPSSLDRAHQLRIALAPGTPPKILEEFERRFGVRLMEAHGMTETNAAIGPLQDEQRLGFMGKILDGFDAKVIDFDGNQVPDGEPGQLLLSTTTPHAFASGYWRLPEESAKAMVDDWFYTGDRVVCEAGWYRFVDRIKDVIRRRGENISAWEVEQALQSLDSVTSAAVVPVPSELGEDEVMAFIIPAGTIPDPVLLLDACANLLPHFAVPRYVEFVSELPLTETGKVRKVELRERGVGVDTWDAQRVGYVAKR